MPIYTYRHPETGEEFEDFRQMKDSDKPFLAPDGVKCQKIIASGIGGWRLDREIYEIDADYCKKANPEFIKLRNGQRVKYDPNKHF